MAELVARGVQPKPIYDQLCLSEADFEASYDAVKRLCRRIAGQRDVRESDVVIRVETPPGAVGQVDFGYVGEVIDPVSGCPRRAWVFVLVLSYSRMMFARVVFDQRATTWQELHILAFESLDGVPATMVPDNLKSAVVKAAFGTDEPAVQRGYRDLARHYGFQIEPTPPRSPKLKGKVERSVSYVKRFLATRDSSATLDEVNELLERWNAEVASLRVHGTTGRVPAQVFAAEERPALKRLPSARFEPVVWRQVRVATDVHVHFEGRHYSVPWQHLGQEAWLRATLRVVTVSIADEVVAVHDRTGPGRRSTLPQHLPEQRAELAERSPPVWCERAAALGPEVRGWVDEQFALQDGVSALKRVQTVVMYLEDLPAGRAASVARRATAYGLKRLREFKNVVQRGLDIEGLPEPVTTPAPSEGARPQYARSIEQLYLRHKEANHDWQ